MIPFLLKFFNLFFNRMISKTKLTITTNASNIPHLDLMTSLGINIIDKNISITKKDRIVKPKKNQYLKFFKIKNLRIFRKFSNYSASCDPPKNSVTVHAPNGTVRHRTDWPEQKHLKIWNRSKLYLNFTLVFNFTLHHCEMINENNRK